jgi:hypothetical protein
MNSRKLLSFGLAFLGLLAVLTPCTSNRQATASQTPGNGILIADGTAPIPVPPPPPPSLS